MKTSNDKKRLRIAVSREFAELVEEVASSRGQTPSEMLEELIVAFDKKVSLCKKGVTSRKAVRTNKEKVTRED